MASNNSVRASLDALWALGFGAGLIAVTISITGPLKPTINQKINAMDGVRQA